MAFYSRAERVTLERTSNLPSNIGPGTYNIEKPKRVKRSAAPFASRARRAGAGAEAAVGGVGPGAYDAQDPRWADAANTASSAFRSTGKRFTRSWAGADGVPGPGSYDLSASDNFASSARSLSSSSHGRAQQQQQQPPTKLKVQPKSATAPSIPASNQSWGYEETRGGALVPQAPPVKGHTGKGLDAPGPTSYEAHRKPFESVKAPSWAKSTSKRTGFGVETAAKDVGPGHYFQMELTSPQTERRIKKASSVFASRTGRMSLGGPGRLQDEGPAPGSYNVRSQFEKAPVPEHLQFFGSTGSRAALGNPNPFVATAGGTEAAVGPGTYNDLRGSFEKGSGPIYKMNHGAFLSTGPRFKEAQTKAAVPGPGAYANDGRDLASTLAKKTVGRAGVFGSSEFRERPIPGLAPGANLADSPAPGSYDIASSLGEKNPATRGKISSSFKSTAKRFEAVNRNVVENPGAGTYDPSPAKASSREAYMTVATKGAFGSTSGRFSQSAPPAGAASNLGPGHYDTAPVASAGSPKRMAASSFPRDERFHEQRAANLPGPGQYDASGVYSLNKRSYNITVAQNDRAMYSL
jgi:hypothetical protein